MATTKTEAVNPEAVYDQKVAVNIPLLDDDTGRLDQTVTVERNGYILRIKRGERVEIPVWAFMILKQSGKFDSI